METLLGRIPQSEPGILRGYKRAKLRNRVFPAVLRDIKSNTVGRVYLDLNADEITLLHAFEWEGYQRSTEPVLSCNGAILICLVYILPPESKSELSETAWDEQRFIDEDLSSYLRTCREWLHHFKKANANLARATEITTYNRQ